MTDDVAFALREGNTGTQVINCCLPLIQLNSENPLTDTPNVLNLILDSRYDNQD